MIAFSAASRVLAAKIKNKTHADSELFGTSVSFCCNYDSFWELNKIHTHKNVSAIQNIINRLLAYLLLLIFPFSQFTNIYQARFFSKFYFQR
jgi:hypothetical protein